MKIVNHSIAFGYDDACTNQAESFFSRIRSAEWVSITTSRACT
jgi:hypothetical protein